MAKRNRRSFEKFQKEIKRKKKAKEKMDRRQGRQTEEEEMMMGQNLPAKPADGEEPQPEVEAPPATDETKPDAP